MKRVTKILVTAGAALSLGLAAAAVSAHPYGPGWGGGHMGGYAQGHGMGPGMMGGYGPGYGMGPGMMGGYGPGYGMGPGMMGGYGPGYGMGPGMMGAWGNADEGLAALKTELGITAKQDSAWQAYADNAKKHQETRQAWFAKMQEARGAANSAPELLALQTEHMKQRQAEMAANAAALKDLYATLTPEQKAIADQRFGGIGPGWHQGYRGGARGYAR
jgi:Spy/CpxP family protein refolding chaperone